MYGPDIMMIWINYHNYTYPVNGLFHFTAGVSLSTTCTYYNIHCVNLRILHGKKTQVHLQEIKVLQHLPTNSPHVIQLHPTRTTHTPTYYHGSPITHIFFFFGDGLSDEVFTHTIQGTDVWFFFGKRGRSWHVVCVISRIGTDATLEVECHVRLFNACIQNWYAVGSIIEDVLKNVKEKNPKISAAFLKSDNAFCYHSSQLLLTLPDIGKRAGIEIKRYDSSDPQSGKDICDTKTAPMKGHIRRFINEKHDAVTAEDMKIAGGVKGCNCIVAEVDVSEAPEAGSHF